MVVALRLLLGALLFAAGAVGLFFLALETPGVKGELRCWLTDTFYEDYAAQPPPGGAAQVPIVAETPPVRSKCDAADDPAIWRNPEDPERSLIVATDKQWGLMVYDLAGALVSERALGAVNNVDIRDGILVGGQARVIVAASHKDDGRILVFALDPASGRLDDLLAAPIDARVEEETYGLCLYRSPRDGALYAIATDKSGGVEQWALADDGAGRLAGTFVRRLRVESQPEGCAADDANAALFVGEEDVGIWRFEAEPTGSPDGVLIARTGLGTPDGGVLRADVEGLALYIPDPTDRRAGALVASSQGSGTYAVFDRAPPHAFRGHVEIAYDGFLTGDTDGLDIAAGGFGPAFPRGLLVVQDGANRTPDRSRARRQNFKLVSWAAVEDALANAAPDAAAR